MSGATSLDLSQIRTDALSSASTFRTLIGVYSSAQVDALIAAIDGLTAEDIDTLAEINAILTDADIASVSYVDGLAANYATAAQGALADSAVQPGDLASVATSGAYSDLSGTPTLGTAASLDAGDFATAAQGALADSALQASDITSGTITPGTGDIDFSSLGGGIGGSTGSTDNAILRADGTGGSTLQNSGVTISDLSEVLIVSGGVSAKPLCVRAAASQTSPVFEHQNSSGTRRFWLSNSIAGSSDVEGVLRNGTLLACYGWNSTDWLVLSGGNGTLCYHNFVFGTGLTARLRTDGTVTLQNNTTDSSNNNTLYVKNGELWFRGGSGTLTKLANS